MAVADDLDRVAELCRLGARQCLDEMLALGPRPAAAAGALLWDQQELSLQSKVDRLTALVSKLSAEAVVENLSDYAAQLKSVGDCAEAAEDKIREIQKVSDLLTRLSKVLDLGLAILAAAAAPTPATIAAVVAAAEGLGNN